MADRLKSANLPMTPDKPRPLRSWWIAQITRDAHGKNDPVFDGDWSFKQTCRFKERKPRIPDPKLVRLKMELALVLADRERAAWQASQDARSPQEKEIARLKCQLADLLRKRDRVCNP